jgi:hypothetical protein
LGIVSTPKDGTTKKWDFITGLRVIWPDVKPCEEVTKAVEDLRHKGNLTGKELERLQLYLMSVQYNPGEMAVFSLNIRFVIIFDKGSNYEGLYY